MLGDMPPEKRRRGELVPADASGVVSWALAIALARRPIAQSARKSAITRQKRRTFNVREMPVVERRLVAARRVLRGLGGGGAFALPLPALERALAGVAQPPRSGTERSELAT